MTRIASQLHARLRLSFQFSHGRLGRPLARRSPRISSIDHTHRARGGEMPAHRIDPRPPHGCHGNLRGTDLLRETKAQGHLIPGLEGSFRADPRAPNRKITDQPHIDDRLSQPASRPDREERAQANGVSIRTLGWRRKRFKADGRRPSSPTGCPCIWLLYNKDGWIEKMISKNDTGHRSKGDRPASEGKPGPKPLCSPNSHSAKNGVRGCGPFTRAPQRTRPVPRSETNQSHP